MRNRNRDDERSDFLPSDITYDEETETYYLEFERDRMRSLGTTIVLAIAAISESDPAELPVLNDAINPEAIDAFFAASPEVDRVETDRLGFSYCGYRITAYGDGLIAIRETDCRDPEVEPE